MDRARERGGRTRASGALARGLAAGALFAAAAAAGGCSERTAAPRLDAVYEPSPPEVVAAMLDLAKVGPGDVVYDLGCGDGRIVIAAARRGARGVGVDVDPARVREARANARAAGVDHLVEIREEDLHRTSVRDATVVMLFLQPEANLRLRPRLLAELPPGARIVSHWHDMGDWKPDAQVRVASRNVYLWTVPEAR